MCKCTCSVWVHGKDLTWRSRRANWNLHPDLKTCISSFQNQPPYKHLTCIHAQLTAALKNFFFFLKKAHSDVNHRKMGRDQKKNDILFVFLYFRETASLTSSLNGTPKQLEALHVQTLVTQVWSGSIMLFLCFLTESGIVLSTGLSPFITRL